jgi:hypothetical protein
VIDDEETVDSTLTATSSPRSSLIPEIASKCSKQTKIEKLRSSLRVKGEAEGEREDVRMNVSLDAIKRCYGVNPQAMRALHNALDNETKFSNPTNAYLNIPEASDEPPRAVIISERGIAAPVAPITATSTIPTPSVVSSSRDILITSIMSPVTAGAGAVYKENKPQTWKEKNELVFLKWKEKTSAEESNRRQQFTIPIKQQLLTFTIQYAQLLDDDQTSSSTEPQMMTRAYQTNLSWYNHDC